MAFGKHWSFEELMGKRARLRFDTTNQRAPIQEFGGFLEIFPTKLSDAGDFRCRVDFLHNPTRNTVVNYTVIGKLILR